MARSGLHIPGFIDFNLVTLDSGSTWACDGVTLTFVLGGNRTTSSGFWVAKGRGAEPVVVAVGHLVYL